MDSVEPTAHIKRRDRRAAKTLAVALSVNSVIAIAKIVMGLLSGSVSILADGFDSLLDALSEIIGLIAVFFTAQPADLDVHKVPADPSSKSLKSIANRTKIMYVEFGHHTRQKGNFMV